MPGMGEGEVEFALEILLGDLEILQSHVRTLVAEEFYNSRKTDAGPQHLRSVSVSQLGRKGLQQVARIAKPDTILAGIANWSLRSSTARNSAGRPADRASVQRSRI